jgi:hypothetical protein
MKKVIIIDTREGGDWSLDLLYAGLCKVRGVKNVIDYPVKKKHREWRDNSVIRDWGKERRTLGYVEGNDKMPNRTMMEVFDLAKKGHVDHIIVDERDETHAVYKMLRLDMLTSIPVTVVAGHDRFWNHSPKRVSNIMYPNRVRKMFMANWQPSYDIYNAEKWFLTNYFYRPINWSANFDHYWDPGKRADLLRDKIYDVSFSGYASHPDRKRFIEAVQSEFKSKNLNIFLEEQGDTTKSFMAKPQYFAEMAQSKICLNLRGAAEDGRTLRFFEIPYVGSYMLTQRNPTENQVHPAFLDGQHCSYFETEEQLCETIEKALMQPIWRETIAEAGHYHLMKHHTCEARARYVLEEK